MYTNRNIYIRIPIPYKVNPIVYNFFQMTRVKELEKKNRMRTRTRKVI